MPDQRIDMNMLLRVDSDQKATSSRVDNTDKSLHNLEREVSEIKGLIKAGEAPAWIKHYLLPCAVLVSAAMITAVITLVVKVNGIETFIHENAGFIAGLRLQKNADSPTSAQSIQDVKHVLSDARSANVAISSDAITSTGAKFIQAATTSVDAWSAVQDYLWYRSFLNGTVTPPLGNLRASFGMIIPVTPIPGEKSFPPNVLLSGYTPNAQAARYEPLIPDPKISPQHPASGEAEYVIVDLRGQATSLDGMHLKNIILKNALVYYTGKALKLENVYFVNCRFAIDNTPEGQQFADTALSHPSVTFTPS
jgi:hypothetical protein